MTENNMHGFTRMDWPGDHIMASWLRRNRAIATYSTVGNSNWWRCDGKVVAVAFYDNAASRVTSLWIADGVSAPRKR